MAAVSGGTVAKGHAPDLYSRSRKMLTGVEDTAGQLANLIGNAFKVQI